MLPPLLKSLSFIHALKFAPGLGGIVDDLTGSRCDCKGINICTASASSTTTTTTTTTKKEIDLRMDFNLGIGRWLQFAGGSTLVADHHDGDTDGDSSDSEGSVSTAPSALLFDRLGPLPASGGHHPDHSPMSQVSGECFLQICESLSLKDILALRATNKHLQNLTHTSQIFSSLLRRLYIVPPILPATPEHLFGNIQSGIYEALLRRSLYLAHNFSATVPGPIADKLIVFDAHNRVSKLVWLPGAKYLLSSCRNPGSKHRFTVALWDVEKGVKGLPIVRVPCATEPVNMKARYAMIGGKTHVVFTVTHNIPPVNGRQLTRIQMLATPLGTVDELSKSTEQDQYMANAEDISGPFRLIHDAIIEGVIVDIDMGELDDGTLVLSYITAPRTLVFVYVKIDSEEDTFVSSVSKLMLGQQMHIGDLHNAVMKMKLLPWQNSVLVARFLVPQDQISRAETSLFALEIYHLPGRDETLDNPPIVGCHFTTGLNMVSFEFSDLESHWFSAVRTAGALLNTKSNEKPPPISIFGTTRDPCGFVHFLLPPRAIPGSSIPLPQPSSLPWPSLPQYIYTLPAISVGRQSWSDPTAKPFILPGAYRSLMFTHPRHKAGMDVVERGMEVQRMFAYRSTGEGVPEFSGPTSTGLLKPIMQADGEIAYVQEVGGVPIPGGNVSVEGGENEEEEDEIETENEDPNAVIKGLRFTDESVVEEMKNGLSAIAYDESTGRVVYAIAGKRIDGESDTRVRLLDFGKPIVPFYGMASSRAREKERERARDVDVDMGE